MGRAASRPVALPGKLASPRLGRTFDRTRLFGVLDTLAECPVVWVTAPPGAGKSTLVATWLRRAGVPTLWLQLDAGDADPATFVDSLDTLLFGHDARPADLPAFRADDLADTTGWLRRRLRRYLLHRPPPWALVFDNQQELPADSPLQRALADVVDELPVGVQWLFVSRLPPPPVFARAMLRRQLGVVDADRLRFDDAETLALVRLHGLPDEAAGTLAPAQGWAGGMTLMLLGTAAGRSVPSLDAREHLFEYFAGEVLARMSGRDQQALCAISVLPGATADMAHAVSGHPGAGELLERLAASSLFTDRREGPPTAYVFHALFSEFLQRRLERTQSPDACRALHQRAGRLLADAGRVDAALRCWTDAGCWDDARWLLEQAAPAFVDGGRTEALRRQIDRLPDAERAALAYWRGFCALDTDPEGALVDLAAAFARAAALGDADGELACAAASATALVTLGRIRALDPWIAVLDRHIVRAARPGTEDGEMRLVPGLLAAVVYRAPWHPLADALADRAERLLHRESAPGQRLLMGSLAFHLLWRGHLERLEAIVARIDALGRQNLAAPATLLRWWNVGILVKTLIGQNASAHADARQALELVASEPSIAGQAASAHLLAMMVALAMGDEDEARGRMQAAAQALHPDQATDRAMLEHQRGILALLQDDRPNALRLMRASVLSARAGGHPMREHITLIGNALAAARDASHDEARMLIEQVFAHPFHAGCRWHHWIGGCAAAYVALQRGAVDQALRHLREALAVARECGFRHGPMLFACSDMMPRLAALALASDVEPDVARDLVLRNALKAPPDADEHWPWAVRIHALGAFAVTRHDGPLAAGRKESRRLLELLRVLVAYGDTPVRVDTLADALWPDADGDAARNALDNALHRLRKWLGGDDRILLRQGALSLNPARCWTDVRALQQALASLGSDGDATGPGAAGAAETGRTADDPWPRPRSALDRIRLLYRGLLLPDDDLPLVTARRTALHRQVGQALAGRGESLPDL